jgi:glycosidase
MRGTPTDADLARAIATAHALGLKVILKAPVDLENDASRCRGGISFDMQVG